MLILRAELRGLFALKIWKHNERCSGLEPCGQLGRDSNAVIFLVGRSPKTNGVSIWKQSLM